MLLRHRLQAYIPLPTLTLLALGALLASVYHIQAGILVAAGLTLALGWAISTMRWQAWMMLVLALSLPFSIDMEFGGGLKVIVPSEPLLLLALAVLAWDIILRPGTLSRIFSGESAWAWPFLLVTALVVPFSTMPLVSAKAVAVSWAYILVFFLQLRILIAEVPGLFHRMMRLYSLGMVIILAYSVYRLAGYGWNLVTVKGIFRPFFSDHTILGAASALLAIYWYGRAFLASGLKARSAAVLAGLLFTAAVVFSGSRAALLSLPFGAMIPLFHKIGLRVVHLALLSLAVLAVLLMFRDRVSEKLLSNRYDSSDLQAGLVEQAASVGNVTTDVSNLERLNRWYSGLLMFADRPLTGFGPGTYQYQYIPYQSERFMNRLSVRDPYHIPENSGGSAHSEYILALSEAGAGAFAAWMLILLRWVVIAFRAREGRRRPAPETLIGLACLATYMFHALFNNFLNTDSFAFLFWGTAAWMTVSVESKETSHA